MSWETNDLDTRDEDKARTEHRLREWQEEQETESEE